MIVYGRLLLDPDHAPAPGWLRVADGRIAEIGAAPPDAPEPSDVGADDALVTPGFVDAHLHVPQEASVGCEMPDLLSWLDAVVFPAEAAWADPEVARAQARRAVDRLVRAGTLAYAGYLTSHPHGLDAIAAAHAERPLAGLVGQSLMDRGASAALTGGTPVLPPPPPAGTLRFSVNPRFAPACTDDLLAAAGAEARAGAFVQTHLAEQTGECALVARLFPGAPSYTAVYDEAGLLGPRTLLAHAVHLSAEEWALIAARDAVVVHCPSANTFLRSGLFDLAAARRHGVRVALGSDVAAGPDPAMPRVARAMIEVAKLRALTVDRAAVVPTPAEAWRLITAGNADALGLPDRGRLAVGAAADLLVLRAPVAHDEHLIGRLLYTWQDDYIVTRLVGGIPT